MTTSLKSIKRAIKSPSKTELVLQDTDLLLIAPVVSLANDLLAFEAKHEKATLTLGEMRQSFAHAFCQAMSDCQASYELAQAYKKHLFNTVAQAQKIDVETARKSLNKYIVACVSDGDYPFTEWTKSKSASAVSMSKKRAELASMDDKQLNQSIDSCVKAGDYKQAADLSKERDRRVKAKASELKKAESKATTSLKAELKKFITGLSGDELVAMVYARNNINVIIKLAKQAN